MPKFCEVITRVGAGIALAALVGAMVGCPHGGTPKGASEVPAYIPEEPSETPMVRVSARRETSYARLELPQVVVGMKIHVGALPSGVTVGLCSTRLHRSEMVSPLADQLLGTPQFSADTGSYLWPLPRDAKAEKDAKGGGEGERVYIVTEPMPLYVRLDVAATAEAGAVQVPVGVEMPGKGGGAGKTEAHDLSLLISEVVLPTEPRILAAATTTVDELSRLFPATFGSFNAIFLDRGDADHAAAVEQLDTLVKAGEQQGVALFVEDLAPAVKVDDVGKVGVDWDAYDRVMTPYMDGSAFADRVPLQVWLAPVPPRRIRDTPTQLRQYLANCVEHFIAKGWVATPAFLHPALVDPEAEPGLRDEISKVLRMHLSKDVLAVTTPDVQIPQPRLWVVDDTDARLPPAGALGNEQSVRVWPWVCAARGVRGFVWRGAVETVEALAKEQGGAVTLGSGRRPLLVAESETRNAKRETRNGGGAKEGEVVRVLPSLRMVWLNAGLNDVAMFGLLEKRGDAGLVAEVLAGVVGRTGLTETRNAKRETRNEAGVDDGAVGAGLPVPPTGFLYAGWPMARRTWASLPALLEKLVVANDPGRTVKVAAGDPVYLAAQMWLAEAHRPVARVAGYTFGVMPGREGPVVEAGMEVLLENPVDVGAQFQMRLADLPGDFGVDTAGKDVPVAAYGLARLRVLAAGHLEALREAPRTVPAEITERNGGATIELPVLLPVYRMTAVGTAGPPKIDGQGDDWVLSAQARSFGPMGVGMRYLSRVDLLAGKVREEEGETRNVVGRAAARWMYDGEYVYALIRCEQGAVAEEKTNEWPIVDRRWWGTDGVQILIGGGTKLGGGQKVYRIGVKPGGVVLVRAGAVKKSEVSGQKAEEMEWVEGPTGIKYGITTDRTGYTVELALPRKWFGEGEKSAGGVGGDAKWRVNVLRHRGSDLVSTSWSGPVVDDLDFGMMGLLVGE